MCIYEYDTPNGVARASYQVLTTASAGGGFSLSTSWATKVV